MGRGPTRWILGVAITAAVLTVGSPLVGRGVFHPGDIVLQVAPWQSDAEPDFRPENGLLTDIVDAATPNRAEIRRRILDGSYPLWNPYAAGGVPLGTQPHNGMLSPLHLPYLVLPPWYAPAVAKILQMLVALTFTFLFLRRLGLDGPAALLGGLLFMNSAFLVVWTGFPHTEVAALIPALFWTVDRAIGRRTFPAALPVAVVVALMLLHGFPAVTAYAGLAVGIYAAMRLAFASGLRFRARGLVVARLGAAVVLGAGLSAVQLLPFATSLNEFDRSYRAQESSSVLPLRSLATAAVPNAFGSPGDDVDYTPANAVEMQSFAGASAIVLIFGAMLRMSPGRVPRGVRGFLWGGVATMIVLIYVGGPLLGAFQSLLAPIFEQNASGRLRSVLGFFLAILAAIGFQAFTARDRPKMSKAQRLAWGSCCAAAVLGSFAGVRFLIGVAREAGHVPYLVRQLWIPGVAAVATVVALVAGSRWRPGGHHPVVWVAPVAFAVESIVFATGFLPTIERSEFYPVTPTHRYLAANIGHDRMAADGATMYPGTQTFYRLRTVASHAFHPRPWRELLEAVGVHGPETQPLLGADARTATSPIFDRLGVAFWLTKPEIMPFGRRVRLSTGEGSTMLRTGAPLLFPTALEGIRAVILRVTDRFSAGEDPATIHAELLARDGTVLAGGERRLYAGLRPADFHVPVAEYHAGSGMHPASIRLSIRGGGAGLRVAGEGRVPALSAVVAEDDGLRLDFADGAVVYRRLSALPRIRWAGKGVVADDVGERIRMLANGTDPRTVLLNKPGPAGSGKTADLEIIEDAGDAVRVRVRADGEGYLVVADSIQDGWRAYVDGRPVPIVGAEHAVGAVPVPAGDHLVSLAYRPLAWQRGILISVISLAVLILSAVVGIARREGSRQGTVVESKSLAG
jgi:hypothetical protein